MNTAYNDSQAHFNPSDFAYKAVGAYAEITALRPRISSIAIQDAKSNAREVMQEQGQPQRVDGLTCSIAIDAQNIILERIADNPTSKCTFRHNKRVGSERTSEELREVLAVLITYLNSPNWLVQGSILAETSKRDYIAIQLMIELLETSLVFHISGVSNTWTPALVKLAANGVLSIDIGNFPESIRENIFERRAIAMLRIVQLLDMLVTPFEGWTQDDMAIAKSNLETLSQDLDPEAASTSDIKRMITGVIAKMNSMEINIG